MVTPLFPFRSALLLGSALPLLALAPQALAQQLNEPPTPISAPDAPVPTNDDQIGFAADALEYDSNQEVVTASGNVQLLREGNRLRADKVSQPEARRPGANFRLVEPTAGVLRARGAWELPASEESVTAVLAYDEGPVVVES